MQLNRLSAAYRKVRSMILALRNRLGGWRQLLGACFGLVLAIMLGLSSRPVGEFLVFTLLLLLLFLCILFFLLDWAIARIDGRELIDSIPALSWTRGLQQSWPSLLGAVIVLFLLVNYSQLNLEQWSRPAPIVVPVIVATPEPAGPGSAAETPEADGASSARLWEAAPRVLAVVTNTAPLKVRFLPPLELPVTTTLTATLPVTGTLATVPSPIRPDVIIAEVHRAASPDDEYVVIVNAGPTISMAGWVLRGPGGRVFAFPAAELPAAAALRVYTGGQQALENALFWGLAETVWEPGGQAVLAAGDGTIRDRYMY